nr:zinc finger, CCHC-type [Tanacetum cinerariifolium]
YKEGFYVYKSRLLGHQVLNFKGDKVLQEVSETDLLDFLAFRFVNDKVAAGRYQQVKVLEFFDCPVAQRRLEDKQPEEKKNTDCLVKEQKKIHHGADVGAVIMKPEVPDQEGAKDNAAERYREDSNNNAFAVKKIYAHESLSFNDTVCL